MVDIAGAPSLLDIANAVNSVGSMSPDDSSSCNMCPKTFPNHKLLQQHQQLFHTDKSFVCEICGKAFRFRSNLAEHRSVHTALKPFVCKFCGKSSRLKGNLTKHILKHHKKEQNEQIGKDDIIVKKVGKSNPQEVTVSLLPKEEPQTDYEKSILLSFGFDQGSVDLTNSPPETADSPDNGSLADSSTIKQECMDSDMSTASPLPLNSTVGGSQSLQALLACVSTPPPSSASTQSCGSAKTQCTECGKHFRKGSALQLHMVLNHGFPPPMSAGSSDDKMSECEVPSSHEPTVGEVAVLQNEVKQMKSLLNELKIQQTTAKIEQLLSGLDTRVGRLEKQVEMALNSIYTLVQLQTGINSNVTRFRDDATEQLKAVRSLLSASPIAQGSC